MAVLRNDSLYKAINQVIKTKKTQEALRHAVHAEVDRLWMVEFTDKDNGRDNISLATNYYSKLLDYYKITILQEADLHHPEHKGVTAEEYSIAFAMLYVLAFYNVADDFVKRYSRQQQIVSRYLKFFLGTFNTLDERYRGNINQIMKDVKTHTVDRSKPKNIPLGDLLKLQQMEKKNAK